MPKTRPKVTRDPLDNPYLADKLQKLQALHERTEKLADEQYQKILEAEGKRPVKVRVKPKNPGPRTEQERRERYGAARLPAADLPAEFFTLSEAANQLGYKWKKSVQRLIDKGKLRATKQVVDGKKRWMIHRADLRSYRELDRFKSKVSYVPPLNGRGDFGVFHVYGPWKKTASPRLPTYNLTVSIEEFWRFACKVSESQSDYEAVKTELRSRIKSVADDFQVLYAFDRGARATLKRIVRCIWDRFPCHDIRGIEREDLIEEAVCHLQLKVLPSLWRAESSWVSYLCQGARHFFLDKARDGNKLDIPLSDLASQEELSEAVEDQVVLSKHAYRKWKENEDNET